MMSFEKKSTVNLRTVAERAGLAPCSVSAILNHTPASHVIPQSTKDRVFRAAAELNYRPNLWARSLRTKRTRMVAAVAADFGSGAVARVVAGAQRRLQQRGYLLTLGTADSSEASPMAPFEQRGIEGIIAVDTSLPWDTDLPVAAVELGRMTRMKPLTEAEHDWLAAMGESAAEAIIQQIEQQRTPRRVNIEGKIRPGGYAVPAACGGAVVAASVSA
jgi:DNA-binding LacI/PurR family transcriptional regulator